MAHDYKIQVVFSSPRFLTAFDCIFKSLLARQTDIRAGKFLRYNVSNSFSALRKLWNARLWKLHASGFSRFKTKLACEYVVNCPPFGVRTDRKSHVCSLPFCPFCYARQTVIDPFYRLTGAVQEKLKPPEREQGGFAAFHTVHLVGSDPKVLQFARLLIADSRRREIKMLNSKYGFVQHHLQRQATGIWEVHRYGIAIVSRKDQAAIDEFKATKRSDDECRYITDDLSPQSLRKAFQAAIMFPSWWFKCDLNDLKTATEALSKLRRFALYGKMPKYEKKESEEPVESADEVPPENDYV